MSDQHSTWVKRHDIAAKYPSSGVCDTQYEMRCSCGFTQRASCHEEADAVARGHRRSPAAVAIVWDPGPPLTAETITDQDLHDLFARHCECRDLDGVNVRRPEDGHAAQHDCGTEILADVQHALGIVLFDDIGRVQAIREARARCADVINAARGTR